MENNELQHWGIKGMRWGHRRYQNKDGSLTPAGRKRYDDDDGDDSPYKKQYEAVRREIAAERAAQRNAKSAGKYEAKMAKLEYKQAKQEAKAQEKAEKRKEIAKKVAIGAGIAAAAGLTYYGLKKYRDKQNMNRDMVDKMLDNMKDYTIDDVGPKAAKGRSKFGDIFSKVKTKLEDNIETGPMKDDGDRPRPKTNKPDYDIEIQDAPKKSAPKTEKKRPADIYDVDFEDITPAKKANGEGIFSKIKKKLEDSVETGPMKDDGDRFDQVPKKRKDKTRFGKRDIEVEDAPNKSAYNPKQVSSKSKLRDIFNVDYEDTTSRRVASDYLNSPIAGLLGAGKSSSKPPRTSVNGRTISTIDSRAKDARDKQHDLELRYKNTANEYTKARLKREIEDAKSVARMWEDIARQRREKL